MSMQIHTLPSINITKRDIQLSYPHKLPARFAHYESHCFLLLNNGSKLIAFVFCLLTAFDFFALPASNSVKLVVLKALATMFDLFNPVRFVFLLAIYRLHTMMQIVMKTITVPFESIQKLLGSGGNRTFKFQQSSRLAIVEFLVELLP